jgi:hypothetical protein
LRASSLLRLAERDGVKLAIENHDKIKAYGPPDAIRKWAPAIRGQREAIVSELGQKSKTAKTAKKSGWESLAVLPVGAFVEASPESTPEVHRCACGAVGIIATGWFLRSPEKARWYCGECYRTEGKA